MEIRTDKSFPRACFSERGITALRLLALDRRYMDPQTFAHVPAHRRAVRGCLRRDTLDRQDNNDHALSASHKN
jgi:hypothetical protein